MRNGDHPSSELLGKGIAHNEMKVVWVNSLLKRKSHFIFFTV